MLGRIFLNSRKDVKTERRKDGVFLWVVEELTFLITIFVDEYIGVLTNGLKDEWIGVLTNKQSCVYYQHHSEIFCQNNHICRVDEYIGVLTNRLKDEWMGVLTNKQSCVYYLHHSERLYWNNFQTVLWTKCYNAVKKYSSTKYLWSKIYIFF